MNFGKIILKPKYQGKANQFYMDTDSFIVNIKIEHVYKDIASDVEKRFLAHQTMKLKDRYQKVKIKK